jgi:hypothetical protein
MPIPTAPQTPAANYRFFVCGLVTNELLAEIPFGNVSYGRAIREAGTFNGDIPINVDTQNLDLYENTLPGKTALYVVRDGVCVWGGIIWSRTYDIKNKVLSVSASEYTSYLYHRVAWRTWSNTFAASITIANGVGTATLLDGKTFDFTKDEPVGIIFGLDYNYKYNSSAATTYYVTSDTQQNATSFTFKRRTSPTGEDLSVQASDRVDAESSVSVRQDSYTYARDFLEALSTDFFGLEFQNTELEPGSTNYLRASKASQSGTSATIYVSETPHGLILGQRVTLKNIGSTYNGQAKVTNVGDGGYFVCETVGSGTNSLATISSVKRTITSVSRTVEGIVTYTTSSSHSLLEGDLVEITGLPKMVSGTYTVSSVISSTKFSVITAVYVKASETTVTGTVDKIPYVLSNTFGEFSGNSGLNIDFSTQELSEQDPKDIPVYRGFELTSIGEILERYSNDANGFEYRIDCDYDAGTNSFTRTFVFLPLQPESLTQYINSLTGKMLPAGKYAPVSAFGADQLVFEHPGNILNASMQESAEDSATRFWTQGDDDTGTSGASLPYSADTATAYLEDGWPLLDQVEKVDGTSEEDRLYEYAQRYLNESVPPIASFSVSVDGSIRPLLGTYKPGDWCSVIIDDQFVQLRAQSTLEAGGEERNGILLRKIDSFEVRVPDASAFPEEVTLNLVTEPNVDTAGSYQLSLVQESVTSTGVTLNILINQGSATATNATLFKNDVEILSWTIAANSVLSAQAVVSSLTPNTQYTFTLNGANDTSSVIYVSTEESQA